MAAYTYSSKDVIVTIGGDDVTGYPDGEFVSIDEMNPLYTAVDGADATHTRARRPSTTGILTLTLQATSPTNQILGNYYNQGKMSGNDIFICQVKSISTGETLHSGKAYVVSLPTTGFGVDVPSRAWTIHMPDFETNWERTVELGVNNA